MHPINFFPLSCLNFGVGLGFTKLIQTFQKIFWWKLDTGEQLFLGLFIFQKSIVCLNKNISSPFQAHNTLSLERSFHIYCLTFRDLNGKFWSPYNLLFRWLLDCKVTLFLSLQYQFWSKLRRFKVGNKRLEREGDIQFALEKTRQELLTHCLCRIFENS